MVVDALFGEEDEFDMESDDEEFEDDFRVDAA